jgi:16S rRNA (cytosine1402-N4)-methyltransferase
VSDHEPVLVGEVLEGLAVRGDGRYVDGTYGRGGHSAAILERLGPSGRLLALDKDPVAVRHGRESIEKTDRRFAIQQGGFEELGRYVGPWLGDEPLNGVLLDLGVSSPQLEEAARGFSFSKDGPLDMRLNPNTGRPAAAWLAEVSVPELTRVLRRHGEEPRARAIALALDRARQRAPITTTGQLAAVVAAVYGSMPTRRHPATRTFQAIRIHINQELAALAAGLAQALELLAGGGRLCVISFHSLEDRLVKRFIRDHSREDPVYRGLPDVPSGARPKLRTVGRPIRPGAAEVARNPRARSAVLRIAERR